MFLVPGKVSSGVSFLPGSPLSEGVETSSVYPGWKARLQVSLLLATGVLGKATVL